MRFSLANPCLTVSPETILIEQLEHALAMPRTRPFVLGLCGPQGSGKSTLAAAIAASFQKVAVLSLDDLYRTRAERDGLAEAVHPLLRTRGVPGTHDVALGLATLAALDAGEPVRLPRFDKAKDDRIDPSLWPIVDAAPAIVVLEGWCVGARPQHEAALIQPVNALEQGCDTDARWRHHVNTALAGAYQTLFARIDMLALLRPPDWDAVLGWRLQQEHALRARGAVGAGVMEDAAVRRFVSHYERLTRHIIDDMPGYADLVLQLDKTRECVAFSGGYGAKSHGKAPGSAL
jgi:D-glycerate 3-kinase